MEKRLTLVLVGTHVPAALVTPGCNDNAMRNVNTHTRSQDVTYHGQVCVCVCGLYMNDHRWVSSAIRTGCKLSSGKIY